MARRQPVLCTRGKYAITYSFAVNVMTFSAVMDAKIGTYAVPIWLAISAIGAAPTSAVYCYYSFVVDMKFLFPAAMDASAPQ